MGIGNVLNRTFPQSTVRHTCPIKNGAGDGLFFTVREHKTLYKLAGFRSAASGKLLASIAGSFEEREKEERKAHRRKFGETKKSSSVIGINVLFKATKSP